MNKQFIDGALEVLRDDERQICKQAAHIIAGLVEEIEALQSLNDFQQQQISCMESDIENMKCCENCKSYTNVGSKCLLDMEDSLDCRVNNYLNWKLKDNE